MNPPSLHVAFFRPRYGNFQHWALYLHNGPSNQHLLFEVTGEHPAFVRNPETVLPEKIEGFLHTVFVAVLRPDDIETVRDVAARVTVDNETLEWDCQDYVLEMLNELEGEFILEPQDEEYQYARNVEGEEGSYSLMPGKPGINVH